MFDHIAYLGLQIFRKLSAFGRAWLFLFRVVSGGIAARRTLSVFWRQLYQIGIRSLLIMVISSLFIGMVLALQGFKAFRKLGTTYLIGNMIASSLIRELGPVLTALLFIGGTGTALTSEIGLMKATAQLSSLEIMAIDPIRRVFVPRFWATLLSLPLLTLIFVATGIWGGATISIHLLGIDRGIFWGEMNDSLFFFPETIYCLTKSISFSIIIAWISLFEGYDAVPTAGGVGHATTQGVILSSLSVLAINFFLTLAMGGINGV